MSLHIQAEFIEKKIAYENYLYLRLLWFVHCVSFWPEDYRDIVTMLDPIDLDQIYLSDFDERDWLANIYMFEKQKLLAIYSKEIVDFYFYKKEALPTVIKCVYNSKIDKINADDYTMRSIMFSAWLHFGCLSKAFGFCGFDMKFIDCLELYPGHFEGVVRAFAGRLPAEKIASCLDKPVSYVDEIISVKANLKEVR